MQHWHCERQNEKTHLEGNFDLHFRHSSEQYFLPGLLEETQEILFYYFKLDEQNS